MAFKTGMKQFIPCFIIYCVALLVPGTLVSSARSGQHPVSAQQNEIHIAADESLEDLASNPASWEAHYNLGNYYLDRGQLREALDEYETALNLNSRTAMPHVNSAIALVRLGRRAAAEGSLKKALSLSPDLAVAHYNLGLLAGENGDLLRTEKHLKDAFAADARMADAAHRLCLIIPGDRSEEALDWCQKALAVNPDEPDYGYSLAVIQGRSGDFEAAIATLDSLIQRYSDFGAAYLLQGELYQMAGHDEQALLIYHRMTELFIIGEQHRRIARDRIEALRPSPSPAMP